MVGTVIRLTAILLAVTWVAAGADTDTVYKTVDEQGNVIFTDTPTTGAEEIQVREPQTVRNPEADSYRHKPRRATPRAAARYSAIAISSPADDSTIQDNAGNVNVAVTTTPPLRGGDQIEITIDGGKVASGTQGSYTLNNIDRGTHIVIARIVNAGGKVLTLSAPVTFHLRRQAISRTQ